MSSRYDLEARISTLRRQLAAAEAELARLPEPVEETEPQAQRAGELETVAQNTYCIAGRPDLGTFRVAPVAPLAPAPPAAPSVIRIGGFDYVFKEARWSIPIPEDGVIKPHHSSDFFWPATRARYLVKEINPEAKRQSFDKNIRYIAERVNMTPEQLIKTNPVVIGWRLGVSEVKMSQNFGDYYVLRKGYTCRYGAF